MGLRFSFMYTLDTNAIIYYLNNDTKAVLTLENILNQNFPIYVSSITELELFSFPNLTLAEATEINNILTTLSIIPLDSHLARIAGFLRREYKIKTPDSIIATTAIFTNTTLATRNIQDFQNISEIKLLAI